MNKNNKIILMSLGFNFLLTILIQVITGSPTGWWVFITLIASFTPVMIRNAKCEREHTVQENGK